MTDGGDLFEVVVEHEFEDLQVPVQITDLQNGLYAAKYVIDQPGDYKISVKLGGVHISNSPIFLSSYEQQGCPMRPEQVKASQVLSAISHQQKG